MRFEHRKLLALIVPALGIVSMVLGERFFPFSDYYMFSGTKRDLATFQLVVRKKDGSEEVLNKSQIYPFNRLHINHIIFSKANLNQDFSWSRYFLERAQRKSSDVTNIHVRRVTYDFDFEKHTLSPVRIQEIYQTPP